MRSIRQIAIYSLVSISMCFAADAPRSVKQIQEDLIAADQRAYKHYRIVDMFDPKYHGAFVREDVVPLEKHLALTQELEKVSPNAINARIGECMDLALLSLYEQSDADRELQQDSQSTNHATAVLGIVGTQMSQWWKNQQDADVQQKALDQFEALAKTDSRDDLLSESLLTMARYGAASDEVAMNARQIVLTKLKGPAALKYKARPNKIGFPLVLTGTTVQGKHFSTADWKGKVVLIDFWATWCPPCREELPKMVKLFQDKHSKGLEIVGISNDDARSDLATFLNQHKEMAWPQSFQGRFAGITRLYSVDAIPNVHVIDRNGILREISVAEIPEDLINKLLDEQTKPTTSPTAMIQ